MWVTCRQCRQSDIREAISYGFIHSRRAVPHGPRSSRSPANAEGAVASGDGERWLACLVHESSSPSHFARRVLSVCEIPVPARGDHCGDALVCASHQLNHQPTRPPARPPTRRPTTPCPRRAGRPPGWPGTRICCGWAWAGWVWHPAGLPKGYHTTPQGQSHTMHAPVPSRPAPGPPRGRAAPGRRDATRAPTCKIG
jgi:hypothetical protein